MLQKLQILATILVAVAMCPSVAHVMEFSGKMQLNRKAYLTVQPIYYPGFTFVGGIAEVSGTLASIALASLTPRGASGFWLMWMAAMGMVGVQIVFWTWTQPVNIFWLKSSRLGKLGTELFALSPSGRETDSNASDWRRFRDRWEYSHIVRAGLVLVSFLSLLLAIATHN